MFIQILEFACFSECVISWVKLENNAVLESLVRYFIILASAALMILGTNCVHASALNTIFGYNDDIDRVIEKIDRVLEHGRQIIGQTLDKSDAIAKNHLDHIDGLETRLVSDIKGIEQNISLDIDSKIKQINSIVEAAITDTSKLEKDFFDDLGKAIEKAECAVDKALNERLKNALGSVGELIGTNRIRISPPLLYPGEHKETCYFGYCSADGKISQDFDIDTPFSLTYDSIKKYLLNRLDDIRPDTPIDSLVITYSTLSELSRRAICYHPGVERFVKDYVSFRDKFMQLQEFMQRQGR